MEIRFIEGFLNISSKHHLIVLPTMLAHRSDLLRITARI